MSRRGQLLEKIFWTGGWIYDFSRFATTLLIVGLLTHYFLFTILIVRGKSMEPNYLDGEVYAVNKFSYLVEKPHRYDVVAMYFPGETEKRFIKRVIGLPNETVSVVNGHLYINGKALPEDFLDPSVATIPDMERKLENGEFFVMGDNRNVSSDSRAWGPVPRSFIIGKVGFVIINKNPTNSQLSQLP
jgi:signal peptidase I